MNPQIAQVAPDVTLRWAVTSAPAVGSPVDQLDQSILFDDLHQAFDNAKYGSQGCTLVVWGAYGPNPVVAIAHDGHMFYGDSTAPTNHLRSAYPWVCPEDGFSMEPGLTKREQFALESLNGLLSARRDPLTPQAVDMAAEWAVMAADALLSRLAR